MCDGHGRRPDTTGSRLGPVGELVGASPHVILITRVTRERLCVGRPALMRPDWRWENGGREEGRERKDAGWCEDSRYGGWWAWRAAGRAEAVRAGVVKSVSRLLLVDDLSVSVSVGRQCCHTVQSSLDQRDQPDAVQSYNAVPLSSWFSSLSLSLIHS